MELQAVQVDAKAEVQLRQVDAHGWQVADVPSSKNPAVQRQEPEEMALLVWQVTH